MNGAFLPLPVLHGERVGVRGSQTAAQVAAPHPNPLPTEEWGEGIGPTKPHYTPLGFGGRYRVR